MAADGGRWRPMAADGGRWRPMAAPTPYTLHPKSPTLPTLRWRPMAADGGPHTPTPYTLHPTPYTPKAPLLPFARLVIIYKS